MASGRITKRAVEGIEQPEAGKRSYLWDDKLSGFGCMATHTGARSYIVQYQIGGRGSPTRRYTIGRHGSPWTAEAARERATDLLELIRRGIDPNEKERQDRIAADAHRNDLTRLGFTRYYEHFADKHIDAKELRSAYDVKATFQRDLVPFFKATPITELTRKQVVDRIDKIGERSPSTAVKAYRLLRKMLSWAVERGDLQHSPMEGMKAPYQIRKGNRVLSDAELRLVWQASGMVPKAYGSFVKMLILTGQRLREVAGMRWSEVDLATGVWTFGAERTKNKLGQVCPLAPLTLDLLKSLATEAGDQSDFVFTTNGRSPIAGFSKIKTQIDAEAGKLFRADSRKDGRQVEPWKFHDLRRTFATGCQSLGFPIEHVEACLNHKSGVRGGLAAIYQLHDYLPEKRTVMDAWAKRIEVIMAEEERFNG